MYGLIKDIVNKPEIYSCYTPQLLWNDGYRGSTLLKYHLDGSNNIASRKSSYINESVKWINSLFKLRGKNICDLGCGPGLYTRKFSNLGAEVTGIDISKRAISFAREHNNMDNKVEYKNLDYTKWTPETQYDIITMIYCDFCSLPKDERELLLGKVFKALKPNGTFVFDIFSYSQFERLNELYDFQENLHRGFWFKDNYYGFLKSFLYNEEGVELARYTIINKDGVTEIYNWLKYYKPLEIVNTLRSHGFEKIKLYSDLRGRRFRIDGDEIGVTASKPTSHDI